MDKAIGVWLRTWRLDHDICQAVMAEWVTGGLTQMRQDNVWTQATVSKVEAGRRGLNLLEGVALAEIAKISLADLIQIGQTHA